METEFDEDVDPQPLKSQDLMPSAPILAPKRVVLGSLPTSAVVDKNATNEFNPFKKSSAGKARIWFLGAWNNRIPRRQWRNTVGISSIIFQISDPSAPSKARGGQLDEILSKKASKPAPAPEPALRLAPKQAKLPVSKSKCEIVSTIVFVAYIQNLFSKFKNFVKLEVSFEAIGAFLDEYARESQDYRNV